MAVSRTVSAVETAIARTESRGSESRGTDASHLLKSTSGPAKSPSDPAHSTSAAVKLSSSAAKSASRDFNQVTESMGRKVTHPGPWTLDPRP
eukprot:1732515-Rhodomonas_salina.1